MMKKINILKLLDSVTLHTVWMASLRTVCYLQVYCTQNRAESNSTQKSRPALLGEFQY